MPSKSRVPSPRSKLDMRRKVKKGDVITAKLEVLRVGRNTAGTADVLTVRVPGHDIPVTATAVYLLGEFEDE